MKKNLTVISIIFLIILTTIIKNASKTLESKIYNKKENILLLERKYSLYLLENNYLSSPSKLFEYSQDIEQKNYQPTEVINLNKMIFIKNKVIIKKLIDNE
tara:strand:- start:439 stop:741 length:303 start_codon:yes stop_codon:yes gene_type:complete